MADVETAKRADTRTTAIALTIGLWVAQYAALTARGLLAKTPFLGDLSLWRIVTCGLGAVLCFLMALILRRFSRRSVALQVLLLAVMVLPVSTLWSWANLEILMFARVNATSPFYLLSDLWMNAFIMMWVFASWGAGWLAVQISAALAEREVQLARASALVTDTQNRMLRYQLNPHFMFNTLSALSVLILEERTKQAEGIVVNLAKFLRMSLERSPQDKIPLSEELTIQEQYLSIERIRFEDRLAVETVASDGARRCLVPSLILHPLIENAIKYGVARTDQKVTVRIEASEQAGELTLKVSDDGKSIGGPAPAALGVGLANIRDRLTVLYGDRASLDVREGDDGGFEAVIRMPAER